MKFNLKLLAKALKAQGEGHAQTVAYNYKSGRSAARLLAALPTYKSLVEAAHYDYINELDALEVALKEAAEMREAAKKMLEK